MSELIVRETLNPLAIFTQENGTDPVLEHIKKEVAAFTADVSTAKGRAEIASMAHKVARSKTLLDDLGKNLVAEWKAKSKVVDDSRKKIRDELDALKDQVREPLSKWEEQAAAKEAEFKAAFTKLQDAYMKTDGLTVAQLEDRRLYVLSINPSFFGEDNDVIIQTISLADETLALKIEKAKRDESDKVELEKLRAADEERKRVEQEEMLRAEMAEKARVAAEAKMQAEKDRMELERVNAVKAQEEAERRVIEAEAKVKREAELATARERERAEKARQSEEFETKRRELDMKHRAKVNNEILDALVEHAGVELLVGKKIVEAIARGRIPRVKIGY